MQLYTTKLVNEWQLPQRKIVSDLILKCSINIWGLMLSHFQPEFWCAVCIALMVSAYQNLIKWSDASIIFLITLLQPAWVHFESMHYLATAEVPMKMAISVNVICCSLYSHFIIGVVLFKKYNFCCVKEEKRNVSHGFIKGQAWPLNVPSKTSSKFVWKSQWFY